MKTDAQLMSDVQAELDWDPSIDNRGIVIAVKDGVVVLEGYVPSYIEKCKTEKVVKAVVGVRAVANDIDVKLGASSMRPDPDIASAVLHALTSHVCIPAADLKVIVKDGWVTLEGNVGLWYQREAAEQMVRPLWGVRGVINSIAIRSHVEPRDVQDRIQQAFQRHATLDANGIRIDVRGGEITLAGEVHSLSERDDAGRAAYAAPGAIRVQNNLSVRP